MSLARRSLLLLVCITIATVGCQQQAKLRSGRPPWKPKQAIWPELAQLWESISHSGLEDLHHKSVKPVSIAEIYRRLDTPEFHQLVDGFSATKIPAEFATSEREQAKKDFLDIFGQLRESLKADDQVAAVSLNERLHKTYTHIITIPRQQPPAKPATESHD